MSYVFGTALSTEDPNMSERARPGDDVVRGGVAGDQPARSGRALSCVFETTMSGFTGKLRDEFLNGEIFYTLPEAVLPSTVENVFISEGHGGTLELESRADARGARAHITIPMDLPD
mgnify:FL=1|jgi:hypothetical protein